jgi:hypothetical protein
VHRSRSFGDAQSISRRTQLLAGGSPSFSDRLAYAASVIKEAWSEEQSEEERDDEDDDDNDGETHGEIETHGDYLAVNDGGGDGRREKILLKKKNSEPAPKVPQELLAHGAAMRKRASTGCDIVGTRVPSPLALQLAGTPSSGDQSPDLEWKNNSPKLSSPKGKISPDGKIKSRSGGESFMLPSPLANRTIAELQEGDVKDKDRSRRHSSETRALASKAVYKRAKSMSMTMSSYSPTLPRTVDGVQLQRTTSDRTGLSAEFADEILRAAVISRRCAKPLQSR